MVFVLIKCPLLEAFRFLKLSTQHWPLISFKTQKTGILVAAVPHSEKVHVNQLICNYSKDPPPASHQGIRREQRRTPYRL